MSLIVFVMSMTKHYTCKRNNVCIFASLSYQKFMEYKLEDINEIGILTLRKVSDKTFLSGFKSISNPQYFMLDEIKFRFLDKHTTIHSIYDFLQKDELRSSILRHYNYCQNLSDSYQVIPNFYDYTKKVEVLLTNATKENNYNVEEKAQNKLAAYENLVLREKAYCLSILYKECQKDEDIVAYSHRKSGWTMPDYILNEDFTVSVKTNFGYGRSSYFYLTIIYKDIEIVPYIDLIQYRYCDAGELIQYTKEFDLSQEEWDEAILFMKNSCELALENEDQFLEKYVFSVCAEFDKAFTNLLNCTTFNDMKFLDQKQAYVNIRDTTHNFIEFKGRKISQAISFISILSKLKENEVVQTTINTIIDANEKVLPELQAEKTKQTQTITELRQKANQEAKCMAIEARILDKAVEAMKGPIREYKREMKEWKKSDYNVLAILDATYTKNLNSFVAHRDAETAHKSKIVLLELSVEYLKEYILAIKTMLSSQKG
jgi:hypothetical protein